MCVKRSVPTGAPSYQFDLLEDTHMFRRRVCGGIIIIIIIIIQIIYVGTSVDLKLYFSH
jgi:hypothetical protein